MAVSYDLEARKQKRIADRLRSLSAQLGQGAFDTKPVQMVSGIAVAPSSWELLSQGLRGVASHSMARDADEAEDRLATALYKQKMKQYGLEDKPNETAAEGGSAVAGENTGGGFIDRLPVGVRQDLMLNEGNPAVQREIMRDYARTNEQKNAAASGFQNPYKEYKAKKKFEDRFKQNDREDRQDSDEQRFNAEWRNKNAQQDDAQDFTAKQAGNDLVNQTVTKADGSTISRLVPKRVITGGFSRENPVAFEQPENMTPEQELTARNNKEYMEDENNPNNLISYVPEQDGAVVGVVTPSPAKSRAAAKDLSILAKRLEEARKDADSAISGVVNAEKIGDILEDGNYNSGTGAGAITLGQKAISKIGGLFGFGEGLGKTAANTEKLDSLNAKEVLQQAENQKGPQTQFDAERIEKGVGAGASTLPETREYIYDVNNDVQRNKINYYNNLVNQAKDAGLNSFEPLEIPKVYREGTASKPPKKIENSPQDEIEAEMIRRGLR